MSNKNFSILTATLVLLVFYFISNYNHPALPVQKSSQISSTSTPAVKSSLLIPQSSAASSPTFVVTRVVDGDTIEIDTGEKVRYIGMNTPETVDPRRPVQCFGHEASAYNKNLVENKKVKLIKDVEDKDKYGRLLRYVYLEDGTFVNLKLVQDGYANVYTFPPNVAHKDDFVVAQQQAKTQKLGLWGKCK